MEYRIERIVSFIEEATIEAESMEEAKEKLKTATLDWDVDFQFNPYIQSIRIIGEDEEELEPDWMEEDYVEAENGCIIFNREEFDRFHNWDD